jgi:hypothetical protein
MSISTARQAVAQSKSAPASGFFADKHGSTRDVSEPSQPPTSSSYDQGPELIEAYSRYASNFTVS